MQPSEWPGKYQACGNCGQVRKVLVRLSGLITGGLKPDRSFSRVFCSVACAEVFLEGAAAKAGITDKSYCESEPTLGGM